MRKILCRWANWNDFLLSHLQTEGIWEYGYMWRYNLYYDKYLLKHLRDRKNVLFNRNDLSKKERSDWSQNYTEQAFYCYSEDINTVSVQKFVKVKRLVLCKIIIIIIIIIIIELTHSKTILEITVEIEPQPAALDFKNLSQYSSRSK